MHRTIELMEAHVRDIYRALTGGELRTDALSEPTQGVLSVEAVVRRFIDLETSARQIPTIDERVPPFSFSPLLSMRQKLANHNPVLNNREDDSGTNTKSNRVTSAAESGDHRGAAGVAPEW